MIKTVALAAWNELPLDIQNETDIDKKKATNAIKKACTMYMTVSIITQKDGVQLDDQ